MSGGILSDEERKAIRESLDVEPGDMVVHLTMYNPERAYYQGNQVEIDGNAHCVSMPTAPGDSNIRGHSMLIGKVICTLEEYPSKGHGVTYTKLVRPPKDSLLPPKIFDMGLKNPLLERTDGRAIPLLTELMIFANTEIVLGKIEKLIEKLGIDLTPEVKLALADFREDISGDIGAIDVSAVMSELDAIPVNKDCVAINNIKSMLAK